MNVVNAILGFSLALTYLVVAGVIMPQLHLRRSWVRWAAIVFFVANAITYAALGLGATLGDHDLPFESRYLLASNLVQLAAVSTFVVGIYREFVIDGRPVLIKVRYDDE